MTSSFLERNLRLQPWRYLSEVAKGLCNQGHKVTVLSDVGEDVSHWDTCVSVLRINSITSPLWKRDHDLIDAITGIHCEVVLWHVGLSSFLYQTFPVLADKTNVGIFTSPMYTFQDFKRIGLRKTLNNFSLSGVHLASALSPHWFLRSRIRHSGLTCMVVQTQTLRYQLQQRRLWPGPLQVIPPGVDPIWCQPPRHSRAELRHELGCTPEEHVILYFGSPSALRGLPLLLRAFQIARESNPAMKLVVLSRRRDGELVGEASGIDHLVKNNPSRPFIRLLDGLMSPEQLVDYVSAADVVALPFELVPSDAPLSLLEAAALGKPVVTTRLACLPELVPPELLFLAEPSDPVSLSQQLLNAVGYHSNVPKKQTIIRGWETVGQEWSAFVQGLP